ncbi:hypothetical protein K437DRAFT_115455 [Tilletiaria anomala UBC 951]|uniref:Uncharacterized protein n=1 Tax=Tilletiaria anomala (strain ATCC 24038 / CBS 436.72 / UBC 951) TaxID=1037660 RepID=A0A066WKH6_TILAU|nr:uncharacterized protein K437DRAFT_115455 [Tilletiaria anomala UBC 951]KDN53078.1 hypothetical protein K437DRAFT_115455 [Tilletiaria anomala UBC 951]
MPWAPLASKPASSRLAVTMSSVAFMMPIRDSGQTGKQDQGIFVDQMTRDEGANASGQLVDCTYVCVPSASYGKLAIPSISSDAAEGRHIYACSQHASSGCRENGSIRWVVLRMTLEF